MMVVKRALWAIALVLLLAASLLGCQLAPDVGEETGETPVPPATAVTGSTEEATDTPEPPVTPEPSPTSEEASLPDEDSPTYSSVEVPEAGLSFELLDGWVRQEPEWVWAPEAGSDLLVGLKWLVLEPPQEVEAALLPGPSEIVSVDDVDLSLGSGRQFLVNVFDEATEGSEAQALIQSVQSHILVVVQQGESRLAYDFFAAGADADRLAQAEAALEHLIASIRAQLVVEGDTPASEPAADSPEGGVPQAAAKAIEILARHMALTEGAIELVSWEYVEWSDACLGIHNAGTVCAQVITPGYRVTLSAGGKTFELHTNQSGSSIGIVPSLIP